MIWIEFTWRRMVSSGWLWYYGRVLLSNTVCQPWHSGGTLGFRKTSPEALSCPSAGISDIQFSSLVRLRAAEILNCAFSSGLRSKFKLTDVAVHIERRENGPRSSAQSLCRLWQTGIRWKHSRQRLRGRTKWEQEANSGTALKKMRMKWIV